MKNCEGELAAGEHDMRQRSRGALEEACPSGRALLRLLCLAHAGSACDRTHSSRAMPARGMDSALPLVTALTSSSARERGRAR